jgi:hypothetical protein
MAKQRIRAMGFFQVGDLAKAAAQALRFAGADGRLGTMLDVVDARLATTLGSNAWERYWTTNSWEFRGRSRSGVELLAVHHGGGPLGTPEGMAEVYSRSTREDVGARVPQLLFWDFLDGKFGPVVTVELQPYLKQYEYPFLGCITYGEAEEDPVVHARLGPRAMELLRQHRELAYQWCDEQHIERSPYLIEVESPGNCGYPYRELLDQWAFCHALVIGQPMNMSHSVEDEDGHPKGWRSLVVELGCHERGNGVRMFGIRGSEPLTGDIAPETERSEKRQRRIPKPHITVVDPKHPVDYASSVTPSSYVCGECGARGVKLWRDYQTVLDHQTLLCLHCACAEQGKIRTPTEDGASLYTDVVHHWYRTADMSPDYWNGYDPKEGPPSDAIETKTERERTDQIGWRIPAVPTEANDTFWGYTSVPEAGCKWWNRLPTLPPASGAAAA